jgi:hypothetical protein
VHPVVYNIYLLCGDTPEGLLHQGRAKLHDLPGGHGSRGRCQDTSSLRALFLHDMHHAVVQQEDDVPVVPLRLQRGCSLGGATILPCTLMISYYYLHS